jgi:diadenylate cyclase
VACSALEAKMRGLAVTTLLRHLRWQDAVDVSLLTLLFSWAYQRLRRTFAVQVAFGVISLIAASWLASHLGLILTSYLLSAVSAVVTIVIVVVFQHEIRRGLGRVTPLRWLSQRRATVGPESGSAMIAEAAFAIADRRKGALIVIPRRDLLADHVTPGTVIDARLSAPLLEALFTSMSPLHDGAAVVSSDRVLRAGVVLPLATDALDPGRGTRHRAAMGLASATDALVICVSEERGSVWLVHDEIFEPLADEATLRAALERLVSRSNPAAPEQVRAVRFRGRGAIPYLAIFAGIVVAWAALALDRGHNIVRIVPLEIRGVSNGMVFDPPRYTSVAVELRSSRRELELLPPDAVGAFVDLRGAAPGTGTFPVITDTPAGVEVVSATPAGVQLQLRRRLVPAAPTPSHSLAVAPSPSQRRRGQAPP